MWLAQPWSIYPTPKAVNAGDQYAPLLKRKNRASQSFTLVTSPHFGFARSSCWHTKPLYMGHSNKKMGWRQVGGKQKDFTVWAPDEPCCLDMYLLLGHNLPQDNQTTSRLKCNTIVHFYKYESLLRSVSISEYTVKTVMCLLILPVWWSLGCGITNILYECK